MARYKLSPGEARSWRSFDPGVRSEARLRIRQLAVARASFLGQPFVIVAAPDGTELERVYRGAAIELDEPETSTWVGGDPFARTLLRRRILRTCGAWLARDANAASIDVRASNGDLLERIDRAMADDAEIAADRSEKNQTGERPIGGAAAAQPAASRRPSVPPPAPRKIRTGS